MKFEYCGTGGGCDALIHIAGDIEFLITDGECSAPTDENAQADLNITDTTTGLAVFPSMTFATLDATQHAASVLAQIIEQQNVQKRNPPTSDAWRKASDALAPLFAEMKWIAQTKGVYSE